MLKIKIVEGISGVRVEESFLRSFSENKFWIIKFIRGVLILILLLILFIDDFLY